ncbi:hypothetical protein [Flavobacterium sp.]|uniref:hypothetical protein n=1 Tax=Flavobacterium sp. TaxID=239 RepID=UPI00286E0D8C|nr:hypothetical protein [Flavobacterium sp.]
MGIHISKCQIKPETLAYWRNPTKEEIKFGYGAIHYRDFDFESCFNDNGFQKVKVRASDDGLIYYSCNDEYFTTSTAKLEKIEVN